jgi:hypothetical protein
MRKILKQDKVHSRTAASLERKYRFEKNFEAKVGRDDNDQVVDMVNAAEKPISAAFDQQNGENRVQFKDGSIQLSSPPETRVGVDTDVSNVLLLTFTVGRVDPRKFGLFASGEYLVNESDGSIYWQPSGTVHVKEITEQGETNA